MPVLSKLAFKKCKKTTSYFLQLTGTQVAQHLLQSLYAGIENPVFDENWQTRCAFTLPCDNKVGIIGTEHETFGMIIESQDFFQTQKNLFEILWDVSRIAKPVG